MSNRTIKRTRKLTQLRGRAANRAAAAVVEFAVMLPVMILLVFGSIEMANGIFLKQAISVSAYEGARAGARSGGTEAEVRSRISEVLTSRGIDSQTVTITPSLTGIARGTKVTVTVSVPPSELGTAIPLAFLRTKTFTRSVSMVRQ
jgi:Flp pilus assembly protein TadG